MRLCRFNDDRLGVVDGAQVRDVTAALDVLPPARYPLPRYDLLVAHLTRSSAAPPDWPRAYRRAAVEHYRC